METTSGSGSVQKGASKSPVYVCTRKPGERRGRKPINWTTEDGKYNFF